MSLWEHSALIDGYNAAQGGDEEETSAPSEDDYFAMVGRYADD